MLVSIAGLDKADLLAALYNASRPMGMGFVQYSAAPMKRDEAAQLLGENTYFDYVNGRVMKISLADDVIETGMYDRDNGEGAAERVIDSLRKMLRPDDPRILASGNEGKMASAAQLMPRLNDPTTIDGGVVHLGLDDVKVPLESAIREALKDA